MLQSGSALRSLPPFRQHFVAPFQSLLSRLVRFVPWAEANTVAKAAVPAAIIQLVLRIVGIVHYLQFSSDRLN